jgi:HPP family.
LLLFIPLLIGGVTLLADTLDLLPFLLFPPLVSGAYSLFREPESQYASPRRFVGGMTLGAVCGWIAVTASTRYLQQVPPDALQINPGAAAFAVLLTGLLTWGLDLEEPQAFSTALLVLATGATQIVYVVSVFLSASLVVVVFLIWRSEVYEQRADYLYQTTHADDQVLVPMRGDTAETVATFGARLAAAHETGKIVLFSAVEEAETAATAASTQPSTRTEAPSFVAGVPMTSTSPT